MKKIKTRYLAIIMLIFLISMLSFIPDAKSAEVFPFKSCDASGVSFATSASSACDGDSTTFWTDVEMTKWVRGNLTASASTQYISGIVVSWQLSDDIGPNIAFETWNGITWVEQLTGQISSNVAHNNITYMFVSPVITTSIRISQYISRTAGLGIFDFIPILNPTQNSIKVSNETIILLIIVALLIVLGFKWPIVWLFASISGFVGASFLFRDINSVVDSAIISIISIIVLFFFMAKALGDKLGFGD